MRKHPTSQPKGPRKYCIPQPQCVRRIEGSFAWIDHRLLRNGYLTVMTHEEQALYLFLVLAADRHGVSFYRKEKICDLLALDFGPFDVARDRLIDLKLIAFEPYGAATPNGHYQVLPVNGQPPDFTQQALNQAGLGTLLQTPADVHEQRRSFHEDDDVDPVAWARS
jgi:hypothetical protein